MRGMIRSIKSAEAGIRKRNRRSDRGAIKVMCSVHPCPDTTLEVVLSLFNEERYLNLSLGYNPKAFSKRHR
jgi:hypothetical protein